MSLARLALKNLLRNRRRTILTTTTIVAGVGFFVLGQGFIDGMNENIIAGAVDGTVGHVSARPAGYPTHGHQHPVDVLLHVTPEARALLDREAVAWTERTIFAPLATSGSDSLRVMAIGYEPERDPHVFPRELWKVQGAMPRADGAEIGVSRGVGRLLELEPGDRLVLQVRTHKGALNALEVTVSGVVSANNAAIDGRGIFVPRALARTLLAADPPTHLAVKLERREAAAAFAPRLAAALGAQAEIITWEAETAELLSLQAVRKKALNFVVFILMALAAFGIANTILMAAYERVREVGTLRSMGMTEGGVLRLFLIEGGLMGLAGSLLGVLWGGGLVAWWSRHPIDFSEVFEKQMRGVSVSAFVYTHLQPGVIATAVVLGVLVAVVASLYPARVAARMVPAEAVRAQ
jgi:putative ABC transport system permease protein